MPVPNLAKADWRGTKENRHVTFVGLDQPRNRKESIISVKCQLVTNKKKKQKSSLTHKLIKLTCLFIGETVTIYGFLRISKVIISTLNLPHQHVQICILSFIYSYMANKRFNFFRYEWTLMLLVKTISDLIVNKIPKNQRLSKTNTAIIFGVAMLYCAVYKMNYGSKSYEYFADSCYFKGEALDYQVRRTKFYEILQNEPQRLNCCDLHPKHEGKSCSAFLLNRAVFFSKNAFKWYFKFYLCVHVIFTLRRSGTKILSQQKIFEVAKTSFKSALGSAWNNAVLCLTAFYALPCITGKIFDKNKLSMTKHKAFVLLCYLPIIQKISLLFEPASRHSQLAVFFVAESIKCMVNEFQGITLIPDTDKQNVLQKNKDLMFGMYVFLHMILFTQSNKKSDGIINKMMRSLLQ